MPGFMNELFYIIIENIYYIAALISGLIIILCGVFFSIYKDKFYSRKKYKKLYINEKWFLIGMMDRLTSTFPLVILKNNIKTHLSLGILDQSVLKAVSNALIIASGAASLCMLLLLNGIGQLWYVKTLILIMCLILPYYIMNLLFDLHRHYMSRQIPKMIDEFRSAFIKHRKIKTALKECSLHIDGKLSGIISGTADSPFIGDSLGRLRDRFENVWFNIFTVLLINYKENGGELIEQLYKLNNTMTRYMNVEKKKNKRLIWYELFAAAASVMSIPAVFWLNTAILGKDEGLIIDAGSNMIIGRIIGFSILSLVIIRVLRKL